MNSQISWPEGKRFAFTVFDDTDDSTLSNTRSVYSFLHDRGFRTTKSCWPTSTVADERAHMGQTCDDADYLRWLLELQSKGFEIGWHGSSWHSVGREHVFSAMDRFADLFKQYPRTATNHTRNAEGMYWAGYRLTGWRRIAYTLLTGFRNLGKYEGHIESSDYFWGDLCKEKVKYYRNFVFQDINTLKACPFMPYHDPVEPYVNHWFASSNGGNVRDYSKCIAERNQDRLEEEGGACIMYAHFARGFDEGGKLNEQFETLMDRLAKKSGWFVPVGTLLDYLLEKNGHHDITNVQRRRLERKWLLQKLLVGTI